MARETCLNLHSLGYKKDKPYDANTLDLELAKIEYGIEVQGECEMRKVWRFNELKPRFYYATGGTAYWASRYFKPIARLMMDATRSARSERRLHPEDISYYLELDERLVVWDLSSFTSSLSELKQFMWFIARILESDPEFHSTPLRCFDYAEGIKEIHAWDLFDNYNTVVNVECWYTIDRVLSWFNKDTATSSLQVTNSGLLGVLGNIGCSTAFHGFHIDMTDDRDNGVCVGDDAMKGVRKEMEKVFISHMRLIGDIAADKATVIKEIDNERESHHFKFVKRRLTRDEYGVHLGILHSFPSLAAIFDVADELHDIRDNWTEHEADIVRKFCHQVGAYLWELFDSGVLSPESRLLLDNILAYLYKRCQLPFRGSLPGAKDKRYKNETRLFSVPPLFFDYDRYDWAEYLWSNCEQLYVLLPIDSSAMAFPPFSEHMEFHATDSVFLNILEDVGSVVVHERQMEWVEVEETNYRRFKQQLSGSVVSLYRCTYTSYCPWWFDDCNFNFQIGPHVTSSIAVGLL